MKSSSTKKVYEELYESAHPYTSLGRLREIAKEYSKRFRVPVKVSGKAFPEDDWSDAQLTYPSEDRFEIYLHPIMTYYNERDIRRTIEHEIGHLLHERVDYKKFKSKKLRWSKPRPGYRED